KRLVTRARARGIELAMDIAFQAAPDHPYVKEHRSWFRERPDGTIQYAENPPKKYQDIYPFDFESDDWQEMWAELKSVFDYWSRQGVHVFRVDNPHTKSFPFWEWCIAEVKAAYPETIFLSEAFTRPKVMYRLAKAGFTQSYTYFTWRNTVAELREYLTELTRTEVAEYFRPNFWPNTPDILPEYLQYGGRPAFLTRLILAATLTASYGIYGPAFEALEATPLAPGREEYWESEKYEIRHWPIEPRQRMREVITIVNRIRRENPALQTNRTLAFHDVDNDQLIAYSKTTDDGLNLILTVVNLDPHHVQSGWLALPLDAFGIDPAQPFQVHDLLGGGRYMWNGSRNFIELDPRAMPGHIFHIRRHMKREHDFDYFM
ncbi:MAG: alpha-1,4-glucan--maltose-1-phosphate maltosyltransferase, partial [Thermomicrobiales bacterium]